MLLCASKKNWKLQKIMKNAKNSNSESLDLKIILGDMGSAHWYLQHLPRQSVKVLLRPAP